MKKIWSHISIFFAGLLMSISDIIPGFSGGIALTIIGKIKKVWATTDLIIKPNKKGDRLKGIIFYLFFVCGSVAGVFGFSHIIRLMLTHIPAITFWFFLTLTLCSVLIFLKYNKIHFTNLTKDKGKRKTSWMGLALGFGIIFTIIVVTFCLRGTFTLDDLSPSPKNASDLNRWGVRILVFVAGFLGSASMVTPGVSGALIILMLGSYGYIYAELYSYPSEHVVVLLVYMLCTVLGTVTSMVGLNRLYKRFPQFMNWFFVGTIFASAIGMIWLFHTMLLPADDWRWALIAVAVVLAIALSWLIIHIFNKKQHLLEEH